MATKREIGVEGEDLATKALKKKGYKIIEKNYRSKFGEIDIVAEEKGYLVFIEVKRRNTKSFGGSFDAIDRKKKEHMIRSAQYYLKSHKCFNRKSRFDVVCIDGDELKIIQHAFILEEGARR
jgi:putative endonuclease